jgi:RHS repeat-associated protein
LGQLHRHHDEAGLTTVEVIDFKGNVLEKTRRVIADTPILAAFHQGQATGWKITPFVVDWQIAPGQQLADREAELLEPAAHRTTSSFDALNRIKGMHFPEDVEGRRRELRPEYNRAGGLDRVWLDETLYVERIAYDAKGQRSLIAYGNGVMTRYAYDPQTFRLKRLRSEHYFKPDDLTYHPNGEAFQDFGYDYDLVGNITALRDRAPHSGFLNNAEALTTSDQDLRSLLINGDALNRRFSYDAIYRLRSANGRECDLPPDSPWDDRPRCTDLNRCRGYREQYLYDLMGNILRLRHHDPNGANGNGFTREFTIDSANNRLSKTQIGSGSYSYKFDDNGNMKSETSTRHFEWNHSDEMKVFRTQTDGAQPSVYAQCLYDASGQRVKKFVRKQNGDVEVTDYIDGVFEHHRWAIQSQVGENNHVHMMDDQQRIALKRIGPAHPDDRGPAVQFHLGDYLGSSNVVVDSTGAFVNREEFTPYGETSFGNFAKKRYRFTGKERDEESGLNYHGARYYAPWLGVWIACDPLVVDKRLNLYMYGDNSPLRLVDVTGQSPQEQEVFPYSEEIRQKCKIKQKTFTLRRQNKASTKSKDGPQARKAVAKSGVGVQKTEGEPGRDTGSDGDPKTDRQKTSGLDAHESQESRTATGLDEIIYGGEKLFLHTDMAMADFWPTLLAPFSWDWPVVAKVFYAIALPPMFVLSSFVSVGLHVIGSIENIVGGAVRLTFEILEGAWDFLSERLSPTIVQPIYPEISEGLNEPFSFPETYKVTAQESPPPPARQEATAPKRSPKAHINPPSDWIRHGCSYGPDLP